LLNAEEENAFSENATTMKAKKCFIFTREFLEQITLFAALA